MKIAFTTLACPDWTLEQIISAAKTYGYDGVDFRGLGEELAIYKLPEFSTDLAATAGRLADADLEVAGMGSSAYMFRADKAERSAAVEEVAAYGKLCERLSCGIIRVFGGKRGDTPLDEAIDISVETLEAMARAAGNATVAVETHDDWTDSSLLARVFAKISATNVGVLWDLHNPFRSNGETPQQTFDNIGSRVCYTHIKDSRPTGEGKYEYTMPGEGDVPSAEMIELLKAGGYDGYLVLEWEKRWCPDIAEPETALPAYAEFLRKFK